MAVSSTSDKLSSEINVTQYDFDPGATTETDIAWVDMRDYGTFMAGFFRTIGTGAATLKILANSASNGSGTDVEIKSKTLTSAEPDAVGDTTWIECTAEEIAGAGANLRYVTASVSVATGTDEAVITYVRGQPRFSRDGLTADVIA